MKRVAHGGKVDLREWNLPDLDEALDELVNTARLADAIKGAASEALGYMLDDDDSYAYLPFEWQESDGQNGVAVPDPMVVYVCLALSTDSNFPVWSFNFRDCVLNALENWCDFDTSPETIAECRIPTRAVPRATALRDAIRALADEVDAVITSAADDSAIEVTNEEACE